MRLIDADELLTAFPVGDEPMVTIACIRATIEHMPTIEPKIIRCKDCKYWQTDYGIFGCCFKHGNRISTHKEGYCHLADSAK